MNIALPTVEILIYSRRDCCLCDEAKQVVETAKRRHRLRVIVTEIDIDLDPELLAQYSDEVPVVFVGGKKAFKHRVSEALLVTRIERAAARLESSR